MVAISLYRGNLHDVSGEPRRWSRPPPSISLRQFRALLARRTRALSALNPPPSLNGDSNGLVHPGDPLQQSVEEQGGGSGSIDRKGDAVSADSEHVSSIGPFANGTESPVEVRADDCGEEKKENRASYPIINREKRKSDLEKKLENLNRETHHLVQMFKQILNAEEEIKRHGHQALMHLKVFGESVEETLELLTGMSRMVST